ncbi:MAG: prepilin-type N-terminal cleavage/methylation domain-containing protein [Hyphomicrobiales bacterium]|nr:prepilin-type N-terminal cleavage/methylation domain-containing protein [Hyphomicrobiales bacterium]
MSSAGEATGESGVTLVELLAALAILALIAGLAVSALPLRQRPASVAEAAAEFAAELRRAQVKAMAQNTAVAVSVDVAEKTCAATSGSGAFPQDMAVTVRTAASGVAARTAVLRFFPDGSASGAEVILIRGADMRTISINWLSGHVAVNAHERP